MWGRRQWAPEALPGGHAASSTMEHTPAPPLPPRREGQDLPDPLWFMQPERAVSSRVLCMSRSGCWVARTPLFWLFSYCVACS